MLVLVPQDLIITQATINVDIVTLVAMNVQDLLHQIVLNVLELDFY